MDEVERAQQVLAAEREAVLRKLREERAEAESAAAAQRAWGERVQALLERGRVAGVSIIDMAEALGVSRQWTSHLLAKRETQQALLRGLHWSASPPKAGGEHEDQTD
jgi:hypothetical protein